MSRSSRTFDRVERARFGALAGFELRAQAREPLTTLYALVFFLLALGYAASDAVELVSNRGAVPRTSPWALMLAFGGLTAFGQVITTMIATTAMLRDEALGVRGLVATTGVAPQTWLAARLAGAWGVMLAVYLAMPLGVLTGTLLRAVAGGDTMPAFAVLAHAARAFAIITVPTTILVTVCLAAAAVRTQRVLGVLIAALALVAVWQCALTLESRAAWRTVGALLDPFANAPVLAAAHGWSDAEKSTRLVPGTGVLLANRVLWLGVAAALVAWLLTRGRARLFAPATHPASTVQGRAAARVIAALAHATSARESLRLFTRGWITLDGGWRAVSALAVLNAGANAWAATRGAASAATILDAVYTHSRLFLILLATVYAGELVWRERDVRVASVLDAIGVAPRALFTGRLLGVVQAQLAVIGPLVLVGALLAFGSAPTLRTAALILTWAVFTLWLPFVQLTALSLAVHALLNHKVAAHLVLITGWVMAVVLDRQGVSAWWVRFAEPAPLLLQDAIPLALHAQRGAYWSAVGAALLWVAYRWWPTGTVLRVTSRR
ncbi:MAG: hypothetical protein K2R93_20400 [Gemmatimonadaceae bacterium]|nr:hypothetical protein [Gemmatimonadaceae bacterium]